MSRMRRGAGQSETGLYIKKGNPMGVCSGDFPFLCTRAYPARRRGRSSSLLNDCLDNSGL
ncbi:hypothetical protein D3Z50_02230 [Clostridiaceae bacterium]|nr:hypothetical protein [Clostridiaceae bacterium]